MEGNAAAVVVGADQCGDEGAEGLALVVAARPRAGEREDERRHRRVESGDVLVQQGQLVAFVHERELVLLGGGEAVGGCGDELLALRLELLAVLLLGGELVGEFLLGCAEGLRDGEGKGVRGRLRVGGGWWASKVTTRAWQCLCGRGEVERGGCLT